MSPFDVEDVAVLQRLPLLGTRKPKEESAHLVLGEGKIIKRVLLVPEERRAAHAVGDHEQAVVGAQHVGISLSERTSPV